MSCPEIEPTLPPLTEWYPHRGAQKPIDIIATTLPGDLTQELAEAKEAVSMATTPNPVEQEHLQDTIDTRRKLGRPLLRASLGMAALTLTTTAGLMACATAYLDPPYTHPHQAVPVETALEATFMPLGIATTGIYIGTTIAGQVALTGRKRTRYDRAYTRARNAAGLPPDPPENIDLDEGYEN